MRNKAMRNYIPISSADVKAILKETSILTGFSEREVKEFLLQGYSHTEIRTNKSYYHTRSRSSQNGVIYQSNKNNQNIIGIKKSVKL